jgi:hypothetical protein
MADQGKAQLTATDLVLWAAWPVRLALGGLRHDEWLG